MEGLSEDEFFCDLESEDFFEESVEVLDSLDFSFEDFLLSEEFESTLSDDLPMELDLLP
tara:strand:- start:3047 stop:3223 length:177 start_codon:yes stop_codon:yes gene_type:complete